MSSAKNDLSSDSISSTSSPSIKSEMSTPDDLSYQVPADVSFQTKDLEELLNVIDDLRALGISRFIDLPQLIVCGDQSSGKSSVLEAVSGVRFPTKDNLCTRFPTELVLRRSPHVSSDVTIVPDSRRPEHEQKKLQSFQAETDVIQDFASIVDAASVAMGIDDSSKKFSYDVLRVELCAPTLPHLTMVDLPGLFHAGNRTQSEGDAEAIKGLVTNYMKKARSIILAVVSAKNDFANQIVTKYASEVDPHGNRTLGIITKPDTLHIGSESEKQYIELAQNKDVKLRLGWHVLKNRDFDTRHYTADERDEAESIFFSKGQWTSLPPAHVGIGSLKTRLSNVLRDHIITELPSLMKDVQSNIQECRGRLERLGDARSTSREQRLYLHQVSEGFRELVQAAVQGQYQNKFFNDTEEGFGYSRRIRAIVFNLLDQFKEDMRQKGHMYRIADREQLDSQYGQSSTPILISRDDRLRAISKLVKNNRGLELPGFQKFETITILMREQCTPWTTIIKKYTDLIFEDVRSALYAALEETADQTTVDGVRRFILNPALERMRKDLDGEVSRNLEQQVNGNPITFNHYFTTNLQKFRAEYETEILNQRLITFFDHDGKTSETMEPRVFSIDSLVQTITSRNEEDMDRFTCSEALHYMEAYYKVALKFFIDDFAVHTIEQGLLQKLKTVFDPIGVLKLDEDLIETIAGETEEAMAERASSGSKLKSLNKALSVLHNLDRGARRTKSESLVDDED